MFSNLKKTMKLGVEVDFEKHEPFRNGEIILILQNSNNTSMSDIFTFPVEVESFIVL